MPLATSANELDTGETGIAAGRKKVSVEIAAHFGRDGASEVR